MAVKNILFLGLSFLTFVLIACNRDQSIVDPHLGPTLNFIFPSERLPANSSLMIVFIGRIDENAVDFRVSGVDGKVTEKREGILLWEPSSLLPLGPTTLEVSGKSIEDVSFWRWRQTSLELEVVPPDVTPPTLIGTTVELIEPRLARQVGNQLLFVFSEPVNWFDAKAAFEPNMAKKPKNQLEEIQSELFVFSGYPLMVVVHLAYPLRFQEGVSYQVTLQGIRDLAGNPAGDVQRVYQVP